MILFKKALVKECNQVKKVTTLRILSSLTLLLPLRILTDQKSQPPARINFQTMSTPTQMPIWLTNPNTLKILMALNRCQAQPITNKLQSLRSKRLKRLLMTKIMKMKIKLSYPLRSLMTKSLAFLSQKLSALKVTQLKRKSMLWTLTTKKLYRAQSQLNGSLT